MRHWLRLLRVSGVATIFSNILAACGLCLVVGEGADPRWLVARGWTGGSQGVLVVAACVAIYLAGMLWNDVVDAERDRTLHPERPLPRGAIRLVTACVVGIGLTAAALAAAAAVELGLRLAGLVLLAAFLYNFATKSVPWLGAANLALVRGLHALFAVLALGSDALLVAVTRDDGSFAVPIYCLLIMGWIFGVSLIAELESRTSRRAELLGAGALLIACIGFGVVLVLRGPWLGLLTRGAPTEMALAACALGLMGVIALGLLILILRPWIAALRSGTRASIGPIVRAGLGGIILFDALVLCAAHPLLALAALALYPIHRLIAAIARMD